MPKHMQSICPCEFCKATRNYRTMHPSYPFTNEEIRHTRRIVWKKAVIDWFKSLTS